MAHRPGHLAAGMKRVGEAVLQRGAIEHRRPLGERNRVDRGGRSEGLIPVRDELAAGPRAEHVVLRLADRRVLARRGDRRHVHRIAVEPRPRQLIAVGGLRRTERQQHLPAQLGERVVAVDRGIAREPGDAGRILEVVRAAAAELRREALVHPLQTASSAAGSGTRRGGTTALPAPSSIRPRRTDRPAGRRACARRCTSGA